MKRLLRLLVRSLFKRTSSMTHKMHSTKLLNKPLPFKTREPLRKLNKKNRDNSLMLKLTMNTTRVLSRIPRLVLNSSMKLKKMLRMRKTRLLLVSQDSSTLLMKTTNLKLLRSLLMSSMPLTLEKSKTWKTLKTSISLTTPSPDNNSGN